MAESCAPSLLSHDVGQKNLLRIFQPKIAQYINRPSRLLAHLGRVISIGDKRAILDGEKRNSREAVGMLVDALLESKDPCWFKTFMEALKKEKFVPLHKILNLEEVKDGQKYEELLQFHLEMLLDVDPNQLMTYFFEKDIISRQYMDEIMTEARLVGRRSAVQRLLLDIPFLHDDWFYHLVNALKANDYIDLLNDIDPALIDAGSLNSVDRIVDCKYRKLNRTRESELRRSETGFIAATSQKKTTERVDGVDQTVPINGADAVHVNDALSSQDAETELKCAAVNITRNELDSVTVDGAVDDYHVNLVADDDVSEAGDFDFRSTAGLDENLNARFADMSLSSDTSSYTFSPRSGDSSFNQLSPFDDKKLNNKQIPFDSNIDSLPTLMPSLSSDPPVCEPLTLRGYQRELTTSAVEGKNCLIVAPTGSGKTHVAMAIAKHHLLTARMEEDRKVVFFVPTVALVEQQLRQFQRYMVRGCRCQAVSGNETPNLNVSELVKVSDVILMTPQIMLNALDSKQLESLTILTLMIFDECHRMTGSHPYNGIMSKYYVDEILDERPTAARLPQVVGLTASPGSGQAASVDSAVEHIIQLCANMTATEICAVRDKNNLNEMMAHINKPTEDTEEVRGRTNDPFLRRVSQVMCTIESAIQKRPEIPRLVNEVHNIEQLIQPPALRGTDPYVQFVSKLKKGIAVIYDQNVRRFFVSCVRHLEVYNNALVINADCRTKDALGYITREFAEFASHRGSMAYDDTDRWLDQLFIDMEPDLISISNSPESRNPKLEMLERKILEFYEENSESQGIVFCKTREMTVALVNWIKETRNLAFLNPHHLVGNASAQKQGMTHSKLEDVLKYFKGGTHKIIVATSVAEEGLDVRKCNYVIRYEHVTNDIARVQARGRARADDAQFVLLAERGRGTIERDEANRMREMLTSKAMERIYTMDPDVIKAKVREFQLRGKTDREIAAHGRSMNEERRKARTREGDYELRCVKCNQLASWSSDLRIIEKAHHVTLDENFYQRVTFEPHHTPKKYDDWVKMEKIYCKICRTSWGIRATYKGVLCCVLKVETLVVIDPHQKRFYNKKWKNVPFIVAEFTSEDMGILSEIAMIADAPK